MSARAPGGPAARAREPRARHAPGPAPQLRGEDIVILASAPWHQAARVNCHHVAERLAQHNRVLYVESPGLRVPHPLHRADVVKAWRRVGGWVRGALRGSWRAQEGLHVCSPPAPPLVGGRALERIGRRRLAGATVRAASGLRLRRPVFWSFLPSGAHVVGSLDESAVVYHCVDDYAGNPGVDSARLERLERELASAADLCLATSRPLADRLSKSSARVACVSNAAEIERFLSAPDGTPPELARLRRPILGYAGNVASYKVDLGLLARAAQRRPDWSFVLVGPQGSGDPATRLAELRALPNVHLLGPRPLAEVPSYVHAFDVCLLPLRRARAAESSLPLKTFEYLAAGKPVVARPTAALRAERLHGLVAWADSDRELVTAARAALVEPAGELAGARRSRAASHSWSRRFPEIEAHVAETLARKRADLP